MQFFVNENIYIYNSWINQDQLYFTLGDFLDNLKQAILYILESYKISMKY